MGKNFYYENAVKGRLLNGHIYAVPETVIRETKIATSIDEPLGKSVRYTGRLQVLKIAADAKKATGLSEGGFFTVNTYTASNPYVLEGGQLHKNPAYPVYLLEDYAALDEWNKDNPDELVPPAGLFHMDQVAFVFG